MTALSASNPIDCTRRLTIPNVPGGRGATTGGDPVAWADSIREVMAFFDRHLRQTKET